MKPSPALSIQKNMKLTLKGRVVGILVADGSDSKEVDSIRKAVEKKGGTCKIVAAKVGGAKMADGTLLRADGQLAGTCRAGRSDRANGHYGRSSHGRCRFQESHEHLLWCVSLYPG
jgi:hypothetical protein